MIARTPPGCSPVVAYLWRTDDGRRYHEAEALDYWLPVPVRVEGSRRYIVVPEVYRHYPDPTHELLANGEERPMPVARGSVYFNRSRRAERRL